MSLSVWWTGKTNQDYLNQGIEEYANRIKHFSKIEIKEFKDSKIKQDPKQLILSEEKELQLQLLKSRYYIVLLDEKGKSFDSVQFSKWIENKLTNSTQLCFIIGGAYGFSKEFKNKAHEIISLSDMTMSHQLIRLVFMEQLYRAFSIIHNLPYHHA